LDSYGSGPVNPDVTWRIFRQIVEGLVHIHGNHTIHRDLTPNNIFADPRGDIKIGDFGLGEGPPPTFFFVFYKARGHVMAFEHWDSSRLRPMSWFSSTEPIPYCGLGERSSAHLLLSCTKPGGHVMAFEH
jgi:serine/threonine protein kinase